VVTRRTRTFQELIVFANNQMAENVLFVQNVPLDLMHPLGFHLGFVQDVVAISLVPDRVSEAPLTPVIDIGFFPIIAGGQPAGNALDERFAATIF
jgi:hypothetical protein